MTVGRMLQCSPFGNEFPEFAGQGELGQAVGELRQTALAEHLGHEILIHCSFATVRVELTFSQFDSLAQHHAQRDVRELQLVGHPERLADVVAVFHEGLAVAGRGRVHGRSARSWHRC